MSFKELNYDDETKEIITSIPRNIFNLYPSKEVKLEHFMLEVLDNNSFKITKLISSMLDAKSFVIFKSLLEKKLFDDADMSFKNKPKKKLNSDFELILTNSIDTSRKFNTNKISLEHIILTFLDTPICDIPSCVELKSIFVNNGITYTSLSKKIASVKNEESVIKDKEKNQQPKNRLKIFKLIESLTDNINALCVNGRVDKTIGRESELRRMVNILGKRKKNNVMIIGDNGVGKTNLVYGLVYNIINNKTAPFLQNKIILNLNYTSLISGTQYRGMLEEKVQNLINEIKKAGDIILFIDDINKISNNNSNNGLQSEIISVLSEFINKNDIQIIASCDFNQYKTLSNNKMFINKFENIKLEQPSLSECCDIISKNKHYYEKYHDIKISDDIIKLVVDLSNRYITERSLPESAFDVIDECGSFIKSNNKKNIVLESNILDTISNMTNIPITKLNTDDRKKLFDIDKILKSKIIGQDDSVDSICQTLKRNRIGISNKNKPSCFLCVGTTGIGKTFLAKKIAEEFFGSEKKLIRFDMSEYSEKNSISKLIGTSPGYIGYEKGGLLTEAVKHNKYCVLLFDEIEKADSEIYNVFLQMFDDGVLTDGSGFKVDFKNTIIILTSNVGAKKQSEFKPLGFNKQNEAEDNVIINKELKRKFPPEFLNRIDDILFFNKLTDEDLKRIIHLELTNLKYRLLENNLTISFESDVNDFIFDKIKDEKENGARPIKRALSKYVETVICDWFLLKNNNKTYNLYVNDDKIMIK